MVDRRCTPPPPPLDLVVSHTLCFADIDQEVVGIGPGC